MKKRKFKSNRKWNTLCRMWNARVPLLNRYFQSHFLPNSILWIGVLDFVAFFGIALSVPRTATLEAISSGKWLCLGITLLVGLLSMVVVALWKKQDLRSYN